MDSVHQKYMCVICDKVLRDAHLTACCGQHFCDSCLTRWTSTSSGGFGGGWSIKKTTCPHCRSENFQSILNKEKIREINTLRVRCTHREKGCEWEGELGSIKKHLESCNYVLVRCNLSGFVEVRYLVGGGFGGWAWEDKLFDEVMLEREACSTTVERRHLQEHQETECLYRMYTCERCGYEDTYDAIAVSGRVKKKDSEVESGRNHYTVCPEFPLDCPNNCGAKGIKRKNMKAHRSKCTKEPIKCTFGGNACIVTRESIENHKRECEFRPYTCEHCGTKGTFSSITGQENFKFYQLLKSCHYDECEEYPVECPNGCGEVGIKRRDVKSHKCPLQPSDCPFTHVGCNVSVPVREMEGHCQENMQTHLLMMAKALQELSDKNKDLAGKNEELTKKNEELSKKNEELSRKAEDMNNGMIRQYATLRGEIDRVDERFS